MKRAGNCPGRYIRTLLLALSIRMGRHTAVLMGNSSTLKTGVRTRQGTLRLRPLTLQYTTFPVCAIIMMGQTIIFSHRDAKEGGFSHEEGNAERIANLKPEQYQELFVVKKETFDKMLEILEDVFTIG